MSKPLGDDLGFLKGQSPGLCGLVSSSMAKGWDKNIDPVWPPQKGRFYAVTQGIFLAADEKTKSLSASFMVQTHLERAGLCYVMLCTISIRESWVPRLGEQMTSSRPGRNGIGEGAVWEDGKTH